jgi:hypothetical protein
VLQLYRWSRRWELRFLTVASALLEGLWLGLLGDRDLARLDDDFYATRAREDVDGASHGYVDDEYNRSGFHAWEKAVLEDTFPQGGRLVVTGAGGGREVLALLERNYDAVGFEPNPRLVDAGNELLRRLGRERRLHLSNRAGLPDGDTRYDGAIVGWGSYMHVPRSDRRIGFLRDLRSHLDAGDPVLVSFLLREDRRYFALVALVANVLRRIHRRERVEVGDRLHPTFLHLFTEDEIRRELAEAGFRVEQIRAEPYGHAVARAS